MNNLTSIGKKSPAWTREFDSLIRAIGECKSKAEEDSIMTQEVETLKPRLKDPKLDKRFLKELLIRLIYIEMLGHDASWGHVKALQACSETNLITKKVAYLASSLFLDYRSDMIILVVNTLTTDLKSDNFLVVCTALTAICKLISQDLINAVLPGVTALLSHPKELVRKKAVMALHRFQQLDPDHEGALSGMDFDRHFRQALCDKDPSVMSAALCALHEVCSRDCRPFKNLVPSFVSILKQVSEHRLPKAYDYHRTPAPFIQIKLLRILGLLGAADKAASDNMYAVIADSMRRANTGHTIGNAIVYEAVRAITAIYPNPALLQSAAEMISTFLRSSSHNLKYTGIDGLARIVRINPKYATEHQFAVIDCLEDPDETLKKKTLELLCKMTKPTNVEVIVEKMIEYLRTANDDLVKADIVKRVSDLAERFAPDTQWFIDTMNQVFELGGDVVPQQLAHNLMRLVAEGAGEEDEGADAELRSQAVQSYLELLAKPRLPSILLKVICWVLGEYGTVSGASAVSVMDQICAVEDRQTVDDGVRGYMLSALAKLSTHSGVALPSSAEDMLHSATHSRNVNLQQRALEVEALLGGPKQSRVMVLPVDASCEDLEVDPGLPFLNSFVQQATNAGAAPYLTEAQRFSMGVVRPAAAGEAADHTHALRFTAYEKAAAPSPAAPAPLAAIPAGAGTSPVRERPAAGFGAPGAAAAAASSAAGPQLQLRGASNRRWGPANFELPPAPSPTPASVPSTVASTPAAPAASQAAASYGQPAEPHVPGKKELLAASLFGDGGAATSRARSRRQGVSSPSKSRPPQPSAASQAAAAPAASAQPTAADLLLELDDPTPGAPSSSTPAPSADPFGMLGDLAQPTPTQSAPSAAQASSRPLASLDELYGAPPSQAVGSPDLLGGLMNPSQQAQQPLQGLNMGRNTAPSQPSHAQAANLLGGLDLNGPAGQSSRAAASTAAWNAQGSQQPKGVKGARPMAPRGNAAVEQQSGKKDPFADLFS